MKSDLTALYADIEQLLLRDQLLLRKRLAGIKKIKNEKSRQSVIELVKTDIVTGQKKIADRRRACPAIIYPENLPVIEKKQAIYQAIRDHQVVIIAGETGSGKTTQIPKICLELGRGVKGLIGHTQPRRLAARSVANRIAEELNVPLGSAVGYKVRFNDQIGDNTFIKLMTDGILLAELHNDKLLLQYDTIIIDEAHERSLNIDFILGYLRQLLPKRPDLKVIITSATIDPERFSQHFDHAPIVEVSGRTYPVEVRYRPIIGDSNDSNRDQLDGIIDAVNELSQQANGDILIFMSGEREIRDTAEALNKLNLKHTEILPLFARLSNSEQNRIFQSHSGRRIVLATNVAETSLTVPGIKYVIDTGYVRISRYSYRTKVQRLPIEPISQASAEQRKGRCGRVSAGICIRLYSEEDFLARPMYTDPEILRTNLASVILQMMAVGLGDINQFPFIEMPDKRNIQDGIRLLEELNAIGKKTADSNYQLTQIGHQLAQLPLDPRLGRMVLEARRHGCVREIMVISSALSIQDPRERPLDKQQIADEKHHRFIDKRSDFLAYLNLWDFVKQQQAILSNAQFRKQCKQDLLNFMRLREWQDIYSQLRQVIKELGIAINSEPADYQAIHISLLAGLLSHIGQKGTDKADFLGVRNTRFMIFPASSLFKKPPKWIIVAELVETNKLWGRIAAIIEPDWIEPLAGHLVKYHYSEPHWSKKQGAVMASESVTLLGLPIVAGRQVNYSKIDPLLCRELFIRHALVEGDWRTSHTFYQQNLTLLAEVEELEHKSRRRDIVVDDDALFDFYEQRIGSQVVSSRHFDRWWKQVSKAQPDLLTFNKDMLMRETANKVTLAEYPNYWQQEALKLPLTYQFEPGNAADGVTVHIPLSLLNQVKDEGFDWQIPGLREELVIALIKSLPKSLRRNFVPAPNYAQAFLQRLPTPQGKLLDCLTRELRLMTGVSIDAEAWPWDQLPSHLKMTFRIVDENNQTIAESRDLTALKIQLKQQIQQTLSAVINTSIEQSGLHIWSFGDLPQLYEQKRGSYVVKAFPALVDEKNSVAIRMFETQLEQKQAMNKGLRRLLLLNIPSPIKYLHEKLPNKSKLGLYFNPFGKVLELIDDCIGCGVDKLIAQFGGLVWTADDYQRLQIYVRTELNDVVVEIARQVEIILTRAFAINKRIKGRVDIHLALPFSDIKSQLSGLIFKGFVTSHGWQKLPDIIRYLNAIERRLEKLGIDPNRDRAHMVRIEHIKQQWQSWLAKLPIAQRQLPEVQAIYWMIEELRVSLFAQQLGTPYPISDKRILQAMGQISLVPE
ncbi:ATP-dependent RNA helicase HrpA [Arsenophonus apicola]|uniref:ATP-dependent RNA helicase HrpA n=1 Tax=Arsenophonus apicola TaxID=2879119 RepID=A0ABY8NZQ1_9GAMM|nr:ATP-dependent RNA helicase HrpA [Arsenophonus apicola]WGO82454.1 ATP-dependent RNA helicase HrpA [Arsenophonus apicola]